MTTYIWDIDYIKAYPTYADQQNVVCTVAWKVIATDGTYNSQISGTVSLPPADPNDFTPYDRLTKDQVLGWVKDILGPTQVTELEAGVTKQLEDLIDPPIVTPPLPWIKSEPDPVEINNEEIIPEQDA